MCSNTNLERSALAQPLLASRCRLQRLGHEFCAAQEIPFVCMRSLHSLEEDYFNLPPSCTVGADVSMGARGAMECLQMKCRMMNAHTSVDSQTLACKRFGNAAVGNDASPGKERS